MEREHLGEPFGRDPRGSDHAWRLIAGRRHLRRAPRRGELLEHQPRARCAGGCDVRPAVRQAGSGGLTHVCVTRVGQVRVPTIVVAGGRDRLIPPATAPELADVMPFAHLRDVPGVGHLLPVFAPEEVVRAVEDIEALGRRA